HGTKGIELVLSENVGRETIGVYAAVSLGIREDVNLAMGLFHGLANGGLFQTASPRHDGLHRMADRVPQFNTRVRAKADQRAAVHVADLAVKVDTIPRLAVACKSPDEASRHDADEGMVEIPFAPHIVGPRFPREVQLVDAVSLGREHPLNV